MWAKAVEISDILLQPGRSRDCWERDVIPEKSEVNKQQEELVLIICTPRRFAGTGLGRTILGPEENILSLAQGFGRLH
jgi:processing peptidase subunit beta